MNPTFANGIAVLVAHGIIPPKAHASLRAMSTISLTSCNHDMHIGMTRQEAMSLNVADLWKDVAINDTIDATLPERLAGIRQ
jgi:hypothetical protein